MPKWYGRIGFEEVKEAGVDEWLPTIIERSYYGDLQRNTARYTGGNKMNEDLNINNEVSIVCDQFAYENFHFMRYIWLYNAKWKITNVEVQYPRLILSIGGVYNGECGPETGMA